MMAAIFTGVLIILFIGAMALIISQAIFGSDSKISDIIYMIDSGMIVVLCITIVIIIIGAALSEGRDVHDGHNHVGISTINNMFECGDYSTSDGFNTGHN